MKFSTFTVFSERCRGTRFPENTIEAMRDLASKGLRNLSISVQSNMDGDLIVFHDECLDVLTESTGYAHYYDTDSLYEIVFKGSANKGFRVPTLEDFIEALLIESERFSLCIELRGAGLAEILKRALESYTGTIGDENCIDLTIASRDQADLASCKRLMPGVKTMAIVCGAPLSYAHDAKASGADQIKVEGDFINPLLIRDAQARGLEVFAGAITHERSLLKLSELGVDGIFIEDARMLEILV